jgi:endonuclease/exonuclease/phosphatase (EEP) superfamily protein YafD
MGGVYWQWDLAAHFRVQYTLAALCLLLLLAVLRRYPWMLVAALLLLINAATIAPLYLSGISTASTEQSAPSIRLLIANVNSYNRQYERLIALVVEEKPDLLLLQETDTRWLTALQALSETYPFQIDRARIDNFGIALLSRIPIEESSIQYFGRARLPSVQVRVRPEGSEALQIILTHPLPPLRRNSYALRDDQLLAIGKTARRLGPRTIVAGDFNATPWCRIFGALLETSGLIDSARGFGLQATWPAGLPGLFRIPIDHCLHSSDLEVLDRRVGQDIGSDHLPLIVDIR